MSRRSERLRQRQEAPPAEKQTPDKKPQEDEVTLHPVWVAIYNDPGCVFKHWALFVEDEQDASESFILNVHGSAGRFRYEEQKMDAHNDRMLSKAIHLGHVRQNQLEDLKRTVRSLEIKNDDMTWNCQDFVWKAVDEIASAGWIDAEDEKYINGKQEVWSQMEGLV